MMLKLVPRSRVWWILGLLASLSVLSTGALPAVEPATEDKPAATEDKSDADADAKPEGDAKEDADAKDDEKPEDPFAVPDGDAAALAKFIADMQAYRPDAPSNIERRNQFTKAHSSIVEAATKLLAAKPDAEQEVAAIVAQLSSLSMLSRLGADGAKDQLTELVAKLKDDERPKVALEAGKLSLIEQYQSLNRSKLEDVRAFAADVKAFIEKSELEPVMGELAMVSAQLLADAGEPEEAAKAFNEYAALFAKSEDRNIASMAARLEGAARKLMLIGQPLELEGTLVDGDKFDWAAYKGKVVLVDFWATWCGPCIAELPNVKETYAKYHDQGFEIVGVSLDDSDQRETLVSFIKENEITWANLLGDTPEASGWKHPLAAKYGINSIPATIVVGRDGNVVSLSARGEALPNLIAELLAAEAAPAAVDAAVVEEEPAPAAAEKPAEKPAPKPGKKPAAKPEKAKPKKEAAPK